MLGSFLAPASAATAATAAGEIGMMMMMKRDLPNEGEEEEGVQERREAGRESGVNEGPDTAQHTYTTEVYELGSH